MKHAIDQVVSFGFIFIHFSLSLQIVGSQAQRERNFGISSLALVVIKKSVKNDLWNVLNGQMFTTTIEHSHFAKHLNASQTVSAPKLKSA